MDYKSIDNTYDLPKVNTKLFTYYYNSNRVQCTNFITVNYCSVLNFKLSLNIIKLTSNIIKIHFTYKRNDLVICIRFK